MPAHVVADGEVVHQKLPTGLQWLPTLHTTWLYVSNLYVFQLSAAQFAGLPRPACHVVELLPSHQCIGRRLGP